MTSLLFLVPLSLLVLVLAVALFFWAVRTGQYDNIDSIALHIVLDDDRQPPPSAKSQVITAAAQDAGNQPQTTG